MSESKIKNLSFQGKFQSLLGGALALVYFLVQGMGAYAVETNFWSERREKADQQKKWTMARLPLGLPATPKNEILPSFSTRVEKSAFSLPGAGRSTGTPPVFGPLAGAVAPYGDVREVFLSPNPQAPLIVHLQDVHEAPEAQRNLGNLTEALKEFKHISLVGMEGAAGAFDLAPYRQYPNKEINRALADLLMEKGYFSGPEAAAIASERPVTLWGVENPGDYRANVEALVEAEKNKARMKEVLSRWETAYGKAEDTWASPAMKKLTESRRAYLANQITLGDYVTFLAQGTPASAGQLKNIERLRRALAQENKLDFAAVEKERLALVEMLTRRLTPQALEGLVQDSLAYRAGRLTFGEYHGALQNFCRNHGVSLSRYPQVEEYIAYVLEAERIDKNALLEEMDTLERAAETAVAKTPEERELVKAGKSLAQMKKLVDHALIPTEWAAYQKAQRDMEETPRILARLGGGGDLTIPKEWVLPFEGFYTQALTRNKALVERLLEKMKTENQPAAALVAGGFHTQGLTELCRKKGISYAVVSPRLTQVPQGGPALDVFTRAPLPLEKLLVGDRLFLASARVTQSGQSPILPPQDKGSLRQATTQTAWVSFQNYLLSQTGQFAESDQAAYREFAMQFSSIGNVSSRVISLPQGLRAMAVRVTTPSGETKEFAVVAAPENSDNFPEYPSFQGTLNLPNGRKILRVYELKALTQRNILKEARWIKDRGQKTVQRILQDLRTRLRDLVAPKLWREVFLSPQRAAVVVGMTLMAFLLASPYVRGGGGAFVSPTWDIFLGLAMAIFGMVLHNRWGKKNTRQINKDQNQISFLKSSGPNRKEKGFVSPVLLVGLGLGVIVSTLVMPWAGPVLAHLAGALVVGGGVFVGGNREALVQGMIARWARWRPWVVQHKSPLLVFGVSTLFILFGAPVESSLLLPILLATSELGVKKPGLVESLYGPSESAVPPIPPFVGSTGGSVQPEKRNEEKPAENESESHEMTEEKRAVLMGTIKKQSKFVQMFNQNQTLYLYSAMNGTSTDRQMALRAVDLLLLSPQGVQSRCLLLHIKADLLLHGSVNGLTNEEKITQTRKTLQMHQATLVKLIEEKGPTKDVQYVGFLGAKRWINLAIETYDGKEMSLSREAVEAAMTYLDMLGVSREERNSDDNYKQVVGPYHIFLGMFTIDEFDQAGIEAGELPEEWQEKMNLALEEFKIGNAYLPEFSLGLTYEANALFRLGRDVESYETVQRVLKTWPNFGAALNLYGEILLKGAKEVVGDDKPKALALLHEALENFRKAREAQGIDRDGLSLEALRLDEVRTLLRLSRWEEAAEDRARWEVEARTQISETIDSFFKGEPRGEELGGPLIRQWLLHVMLRGVQNEDLDLFLKKKNGKKQQELLHATAKVVKLIPETKQLIPLKQAFVHYASDPSKSDGRVSAIQVIAQWGMDDVLDGLLVEALEKDDLDVLPALVQWKGPQLSTLSVDQLTALLHHRMLKKDDALVKLLKGALKAKQGPLEVKLNQLFATLFPNPSGLSAQEREDKRGWVKTLDAQLAKFLEEAAALKIELEKGPLRAARDRFNSKRTDFLQRLDSAAEEQALQQVQNATAKIVARVEYAEKNTVDTFQLKTLDPDLSLIEPKFKKEAGEFSSVQKWFNDLHSRIAAVVGQKTGSRWAAWSTEVENFRTRLRESTFNTGDRDTWKEKLEGWRGELQALKTSAQEFITDQEHQKATQNFLQQMEAAVAEKAMELRVREDLATLDPLFKELSAEDFETQKQNLERALGRLTASYQRETPSPLEVPALAGLIQAVREKMERYHSYLSFAEKWQTRVLSLAARYADATQGKFPLETAEQEEEEILPSVEALQRELVAIQVEAQKLNDEINQFPSPDLIQQNGLKDDLALLNIIKKGVALARDFVDYDLLAWQSHVVSLSDRRNNAEQNFEHPLLLASELVGLVTKAQELLDDAQSSPYAGVIQRYFPGEITLLKNILPTPPPTGGRWPWLEGMYRRVGGWMGLVFLPVVLESVLVPVLMGGAAGLWSGVPLAALLVYQGVWHLFHLPGAREWGFVFSKEKLLISAGVALSVLAVSSLGWGDPSGLSLWAAALLLAVPHAIVNGVMLRQARRSSENDLQPTIVLKSRLSELLLGGSARSQIAYTRYEFSQQDIREKIENQQTTARAQRESLAFVMGLSPKTSLENMLLHLGQTHQRGQSLDSLTGTSSNSDNSIEKQQGHDIGRLLVLATSNQDLKALVRYYHLGQGLLDAGARLNRSLESKSQAQETSRDVLIEISKTLLEGSSTLDPRDQTLLNRLMELANKTPEERQRLTWVLPEGTKVEELKNFFEGNDALRALSGTDLQNHVVVRSRPPDGKLNSIPTLLSKAQNQRDWTKLTPADIYVLDPSEWDMSDLPKQLEGLVHVLVFLAGDLVFDMTGRLAEEVKRINVVSLNA